MNTDKIYTILEAAKTASRRDNHDGLWAECEDYQAHVSSWVAWEDEGRKYGRPAPEFRPSQKDLLETLAFHGYRYSPAKKEVIKK